MHVVPKNANWHPVTSVCRVLNDHDGLHVHLKKDRHHVSETLAP